MSPKEMIQGVVKRITTKKNALPYTDTDIRTTATILIDYYVIKTRKYTIEELLTMLEEDFDLLFQHVMEHQD